ncbi:MAG: hypothetical protein AAF830_13865 [Pseudomonadota bacterium]
MKSRKSKGSTASGSIWKGGLPSYAQAPNVRPPDRFGKGITFCSVWDDTSKVDTFHIKIANNLRYGPLNDAQLQAFYQKAQAVVDNNPEETPIFCSEDFEEAFSLSVAESMKSVSIKETENREEVMKLETSKSY